MPVDRSAAAGFVDETARALREAERMTLVIAPEGTRKRLPQWKSGFYRVAVEAGVPILLVAFDYSRKAVVFGPLVTPSGDYGKDQAWPRAIMGRGRHVERLQATADARRALSRETPSHKRPVSTVFQHYAFFPHRSVVGTVAFALEKRAGRERWTGA